MKFTPLPPEQLSTNPPLLTPGHGHFNVVSASEEQSKSNTPMVKLTLNVTDQHGRAAVLYDYLTDKASWKIKHFLDSIGQSAQYERGEITALSCINKSGKLRIQIRKDPTGQYPDQARVADYLTASKTLPHKDEFDEDIPF